MPSFKERDDEYQHGRALLEEESKHAAQMLPEVLERTGKEDAEDGESDYPLADLYVLATTLAWGRVGMRTIDSIHNVMASVEGKDEDEATDV